MFSEILCIASGVLVFGLFFYWIAYMIGYEKGYKEGEQYALLGMINNVKKIEQYNIKKLYRTKQKSL